MAVDKRRLDARIDRLLKKVKDPKIFRKFGGFVIQTIRIRTRGRGKGVPRPGGREKNLKQVGSKWAKRRLKFERHPEAATGRRSNLTFKGTMLDNMIIKRSDKSGVLVGFRNIKEEKKADGQAEQGRVFLNLSGKEIRSSADFLKSLVLKNV